MIMKKKTPAQISFNMSRIKGMGSRIELLMGRALWKSDFRYRKQYNIVGKPDFALVSKKLAIFCDSSFWHGYKYGMTKRHEFKTNAIFWTDKIQKNILRDKKVNRELKKAGWKVLRFWDFEILKDIDKCVLKVKEQYRKSSP